MSQIAEHRLLQINLCGSDIKNICGRYHFKDIDLPLLQEVYLNYLKDCMVSAYFAWKGKEKIATVLTLGKEIDKIQEDLMGEGKLLEAYMLECISMELLMKAYEDADIFLHKKTGLWCGKYEFPGSDCPIEEVVDILMASGQQEVTCNNTYALIPQKSVAYFIQMQKEKGERERRQPLCAGCTKDSCEGREGRKGKEKEGVVPYGYMRIFGKGGNGK